jgi:hypothetical protein
MRRYRESLPAEEPRPRAAKKDAADKKKAKKKEGECLRVLKNKLMAA